MPAIKPVAQLPGRPVVPGQALVKVKASSNDPSMKVEAKDGIVTIRHTASNNGIIASHLSLQVDGVKLEIPLSKGMTPAQVQTAIAKKLPKPYSLVQFAMMINGGDVAMFRISKPLVAPTLKNDPKAIAEAFAAAQKVPSIGGTKVSVSELKHALNVAKKDGFTKAEKKEFAQQWASLFDGAQFRATAAAQKEFAAMQKKFDLPVVPVR